MRGLRQLIAFRRHVIGDAVIATTPSVADGQIKCPRSRRLAQSDIPTPSCHSTLTRCLDGDRSRNPAMPFRSWLLPPPALDDDVLYVLVGRRRRSTNSISSSRLRRSRSERPIRPMIQRSHSTARRLVVTSLAQITWAAVRSILGRMHLTVSVAIASGRAKVGLLSWRRLSHIPHDSIGCATRHNELLRGYLNSTRSTGFS